MYSKHVNPSIWSWIVHLFFDNAVAKSFRKCPQMSVFSLTSRVEFCVLCRDMLWPLIQPEQKELERPTLHSGLPWCWYGGMAHIAPWPPFMVLATAVHCPQKSVLSSLFSFFFFSFCPLTLSYHHRIGEVEAWHHHRNWCRACEVHACRSADVLHWCGGPQRPHLCRKTGLVHGTAPVATQVTWWPPLCRNTTWHLDLVSAQKSPSQCNKGKKKEKDTQTSHSLVLSPAAEQVHPCEKSSSIVSSVFSPLTKDTSGSFCAAQCPRRQLSPRHQTMHIALARHSVVSCGGFWHHSDVLETLHGRAVTQILDWIHKYEVAVHNSYPLCWREETRDAGRWSGSSISLLDRQRQRCSGDWTPTSRLAGGTHLSQPLTHSVFSV